MRQSIPESQESTLFSQTEVRRECGQAGESEGVRRRAGSLR